MFAIRHECTTDHTAIEQLLDRCFGLDRLAKASYRYRDGVPPLEELCFVAADDQGAIVGSVRYWPVLLDEAPALLLGPLAIEPERQARGIGRALVFHSLESAAVAGHRMVFLVGDPAYYARFGFAVAPAGIMMPKEAPGRLNYRLLDHEIALPASATLRPVRPPARATVARTTGPAAASAKAIATASSIH
jgi:predicted N-acetyltransferase YhbS